MLSWLAHYGGYLLIAAGALLFSTLIPSAAGPADALKGMRAAPPARARAAEAAAPLLIASPRQATGPAARAAGASEAGERPAPAPALEEEAHRAVPAAATPRPTTDRIEIGRIGLDARVVEVGVLPSGEMETAAFAAGRLAYSAEAGDPGNVVLAGHNDIEGEVFRRLPEVQIGEAVLLYRGGQPFRYRVEARTIVREQGAGEAQRRENARWMDPTDDPVVTLISCYPYRVDTHRIIVRARLVE